MIGAITISIVVIILAVESISVAVPVLIIATLGLGTNAWNAGNLHPTTFRQLNTFICATGTLTSTIGITETRIPPLNLVIVVVITTSLDKRILVSDPVTIIIQTVITGFVPA